MDTFSWNLILPTVLPKSLQSVINTDNYPFVGSLEDGELNQRMKCFFWPAWNRRRNVATPKRQKLPEAGHAARNSTVQVKSGKPWEVKRKIAVKMPWFSVSSAAAHAWRRSGV
jgi:hypothetical protein